MKSQNRQLRECNQAQSDTKTNRKISQIIWTIGFQVKDIASYIFYSRLHYYLTALSRRSVFTAHSCNLRLPRYSRPE